MSYEINERSFIVKKASIERDMVFQQTNADSDLTKPLYALTEDWVCKLILNGLCASLETAQKLVQIGGNAIEVTFPDDYDPMKEYEFTVKVNSGLK